MRVRRLNRRRQKPRRFPSLRRPRRRPRSPTGRRPLLLCRTKDALKAADGLHEDAVFFIDDEVAGFCTSGGYSHHAGQSVALGFVPTGAARPGLEVEIEILGEMRPARMITEPLFDADGARMRG